MSAQLTWRALDEAGEARTAANRPAFLPQTLAFWRKRSFGLAIYFTSGTIVRILGRKRRFQMKPAKPRVKVYKPTRFGEGMQPGTVEWELNQRRLRAGRRIDSFEASVRLLLVISDYSRLCLLRCTAPRSTIRVTVHTGNTWKGIDDDVQVQVD